MKVMTENREKLVGGALPPPPVVELPPEVAAVVAYLGAHHGLPTGVALVGVLTASGALAGGARSIKWGERITGINLQVLLHPTAVPETATWVDFIAAPLAVEVERLKRVAPELRRLEHEVEIAIGKLKALADDDPARVQAAAKLRQLGEIAMPNLFVPALPNSKQSDAGGSTLVADATGRALGTALAMTSEADFVGLVGNGSSNRDLALLMAVSTEATAKLFSGGILHEWHPLLLPQAGGTFAEPKLGIEEAARKWQGVVAKLLAVRRSPGRYIIVSDHGAEVLNILKANADEACGRLRGSPWMPSPVGICARIAGILDVLREGHGEPGPGVWADAKALTEWLIEVHIRGVTRLLPKRRGLSPRVYPPQPAEDRERMRALIRRLKTTCYRDLVRQLPKRPRAYWKTHHREAIKLMPPILPGQVASFGAAPRASARPTYPASPACPASPTPEWDANRDSPI